jgi:hypothetical protein
MAGPKGPEEARFLSSEVVVLEIFSLDAVEVSERNLPA